MSLFIFRNAKNVYVSVLDNVQFRQIFERRLCNLKIKKLDNTAKSQRFYHCVINKSDLLSIKKNHIALFQIKKFAAENSNSKGDDKKSSSSAQKLKQAVKEYGSTVIVFHVAISLISLGMFYLLVSSGLDVDKYFAYFGLNKDTAGNFASNAGTFAVAYAVHKIFAPVRITITLGATPFIVKYLRSAGFIKKKL